MRSAILFSVICLATSIERVAEAISGKTLPPLEPETIPIIALVMILFITFDMCEIIGK